MYDRSSLQSGKIRGMVILINPHPSLIPFVPGLSPAQIRCHLAVIRASSDSSKNGLLCFGLLLKLGHKIPNDIGVNHVRQHFQPYIVVSIKVVPFVLAVSGTSSGILYQEPVTTTDCLVCEQMNTVIVLRRVVIKTKFARILIDIVLG